MLIPKPLLHPYNLNLSSNQQTPQSSSHNKSEITKINSNAHCEPNKRPLSDNSSLTIPDSPTKVNLNADRSRNSSKKAKVDRSRYNFSTKTTDKISDGLKPAEDIFFNDSTISFQQFKYVHENYTNKNLNIYNICKNINSDITSLMLLIDSIRPKITERTTKAQLTRLANFLFQALPPPQDN
ncbi:CCHC-type domain-containing protein [Aphis craccivora]|uniref:CCHC-type domain-containing protein n=1 Tax=Aphis craccivora TaxID=307492 RepID=A0A6G0VMP0_APHCR|nr:CCHC-type domain-containing protein [Aphis craccivora]